MVSQAHPQGPEPLQIFGWLMAAGLVVGVFGVRSHPQERSVPTTLPVHAFVIIHIGVTQQHPVHTTTTFCFQSRCFQSTLMDE